MEHYAGAMSTHLKCTHLIWLGQEALPKCGPFFKPFKVNIFYPTMFCLLAQCDLLMGHTKKPIRREGIEPIKRDFTYVLFSVTKWFRIAFYKYNILQKIFSKWKTTLYSQHCL